MTGSGSAAVETLTWHSSRELALVRDMRGILERTGLVRVSGFPTTTREYLNLLRHFGEPLAYYGSDAGTHPEDSTIWKVKYDVDAASRGETHALDGPLPAHSSQSLREPRPRYFSMLMVEQGWQHYAFGSNGESLLAPWALAFGRLREDMGEDMGALLEALFGNVQFPDGSERPVAYKLADARSADDLGVRLKSDLLAFLESSQPNGAGTRAVRLLAEAAHHTALRVSLRNGDLVLLDNDRWGHGRESVVGTAQGADGTYATNPRELWSVTVD